MIRIVRTTTLTRLLNTERAGEAEKWHRLHGEESKRAAAAEDRLATAETEIDRLVLELGQEREALAGIRQDVDRLTAAVADPDTGTEMQRRIALSVLRTLLERAEAETETTGQELNPFFRLVGTLLAPRDQQEVTL